MILAARSRLYLSEFTNLGKHGLMAKYASIQTRTSPPKKLQHFAKFWKMLPACGRASLASNCSLPAACGPASPWRSRLSKSARMLAAPERTQFRICYSADFIEKLAMRTKFDLKAVFLSTKYSNHNRTS